jgi:large repetitive protein
VNPAGTITYTPAAGYRGPDSFSYTVSDGAGGTDSAQVTVSVQNGVPVAADDTASTATSAPVIVPVLANDSDPDGDTVTVAAGSVTAPVVSAPVGPPGAVPAGAVVLNPNGTVTFTPSAGFTGTASFTYAITDGALTSPPATVVVTVANAAPHATDDTATTAVGQPVTVNVLANDTDPNPAQALSLTGAGPAAHGAVTVNAGGTVTYAPTATYRGADAFDYTISDGAGGSDTGHVTINVADHAPVAVDDAATTAAGTAVTVAVVANDTDADSDPLAVVAGSVTPPLAIPPVGPPTGASAGAAVLNPDSTITYTPLAGFAGSASFDYAVTDGTLNAPGTVRITVAAAPTPAGPAVVPAPPVNHAPAYTPAVANTRQGVPAGGALTALAATDPDGDPLDYALLDGALPPGVQLAADGTFTGTAQTAGSYPVVLRVCDNGAPVMCSQTRLVIEVAAAVAGPVSVAATPTPSLSPSPDPAPPAPTPTPTPVGEAAVVVNASPARPQLPHTGAPLALLLWNGLAIVLLGLGASRAGRRRA